MLRRSIGLLRGKTNQASHSLIIATRRDGVFISESGGRIDIQCTAFNCWKATIGSADDSDMLPIFTLQYSITSCSKDKLIAETDLQLCEGHHEEFFLCVHVCDNSAFRDYPITLTYLYYRAGIFCSQHFVFAHLP